MRQNSERLLKLTAKLGTKLIRINPDRPDHKRGAGATISLRNTCLCAISKIDAELKAQLSAAAPQPPKCEGAEGRGGLEGPCTN